MELSEEIFKKEIAMCRKLFQESGGCAWGRCWDCGAILLLYKLHKGRMVEDREEIKKLKEEIFNGA